MLNENRINYTLVDATRFMPGDRAGGPERDAAERERLGLPAGCLRYCPDIDNPDYFVPVESFRTVRPLTAGGYELRIKTTLGEKTTQSDFLSWMQDPCFAESVKKLMQK